MERVGPQVSLCPPGQNSGISNTSFLCCVVGSASLLSATAIFWRLAISRWFVVRSRLVKAALLGLSRVVSVWFGLPNMNGIQPHSLERWSFQVERNMSKAVLVPRNT